MIHSPAARHSGRCLVLFACVLPVAALAQSQLDEIIVTAQKRPESLQETPISLVAFDQRALDAGGITDIGGLRAAVPNLQLIPHPNAASTLRTYLRGVGNNDEQILQDPSVAVYLDGVYVARTQGLAMDLPELRRVEVLRGPQGTLYGRNATGGAINLVTEEPSPEAFGIRQRLSAGSRDLLRSATSVNVPLGGSAALRLAYVRGTEDGFVENRGSGEPRFGDLDREAGRIDLAWRPRDGLSLRYAWDRSEIHDSPAYIGVAPLSGGTADRPHEGSPFVRDLQPNDVVAEGHALTLEREFDSGARLRSISAYREVTDFQNQDANSGLTGPLPLYRTLADGEQEQWSQEFQWLGSAADERLEYIVGVFWLREDMERNSANILPARGTATLVFGRDLVNESMAAFGQATWTPALLDDRLHLTAGLRVSADEREVTLRRGMQNLASGAITMNPVVGEGDRDFDNVSPSVVVAYDLRDSVRIYAEAVSGYKSGGFNARASSIERFEEGFDDETLVSFEAGLKSEWWDRRLRLNAAAFRSAYEDIQVIVQSDPSNVLVSDMLNAGEATIDGLEAELTVALTDALRLDVRYGWLDASFDRVDDALGRDVSDRYRFVYAPDHSFSADLRYEFPALPLGRLAADLSYTWQDDAYANTTTDAGTYVIDAYGLWGARLELELPRMAAGELQLALWGRNLGDEEYYVAYFNAGVPSAFWGAPRSVGADLTLSY